MPSFHNGAVEIAYLDEGEGDPILLVHGFASSKVVNWVYPTWVSELKKNGRRVVALDNRGHGDSAKLYDTEQYHIGSMASDVSALMDHLGIARADIMGYSLGARMTAWLALQAAAAAAVGDFRRHRHRIDRGWWSRGERGAGAGGRLARLTSPIRSDGHSAPLPTRPFRPPRAGRLSAGLAAADDGRGRRHRGAGTDRGRDIGRDRGLGRGARRDHSRCRRARHPRPRSHAAVGDKVYKAGVLDFLHSRGESTIGRHR